MRGGVCTGVGGDGPEDGAKVPIPHRGAFRAGDSASVGGVAWSAALRFDEPSGSWYARRLRLAATRGVDAPPAGSFAAAARAALSLPAPLGVRQGEGSGGGELAMVVMYGAAIGGETGVAHVLAVEVSCLVGFCERAPKSRETDPQTKNAGDYSNPTS